MVAVMCRATADDRMRWGGDVEEDVVVVPGMGKKRMRKEEGGGGEPDTAMRIEEGRQRWYGSNFFGGDMGSRLKRIQGSTTSELGDGVSDGDGSKETMRVSPPGVVNMSPAVSSSGELVAVASRVVVAERGGWLTWNGKGTFFCHYEPSGTERRVTLPRLHCITSAAVGCSGERLIAVAIRWGRKRRHIKPFDLEKGYFSPLTDFLNPELHHYNPFFSLSSDYVGYHRFGAGAWGDSVVPYRKPMRSPTRRSKEEGDDLCHWLSPRHPPPVAITPRRRFAITAATPCRQHGPAGDGLIAV
uniref:DUF295 domain-containing protein n=1 Tax=Oryza punctata TaxID=4537 RepID=A0A0E0LYT3_ORYPU